MKKILSMLLCVAMMASLLVVPAAAENNVTAVPINAELTGEKVVTFSDTAKHWAEKAIDRWAQVGVINGDNGMFKPDDNLTRGELATILTNMLGLTVKAENAYTDMKSDAWYADAVLKCTAAGIMNGANGKANGDATITRQESMVMLARALGIAPVTADLAEFKDGAKVDAWAAGYVTAMTKNKIVNGVGNGLVAPMDKMTRAAVVTVLDKAISDYVNKAGTYDKLVGTGIVLVAAPDVVIKGGQIKDLALANGAVTINGTKVTGNATVLVAGATLNIADGSAVENVVVAAKAANAKVILAKTAKVKAMNTEADGVAVSGTGSIALLTVIGGKNVVVAKETAVAKIDNKSESVVKYGDTEVKANTSSEGSKPSGGGGSIGGGDDGGYVPTDFSGKFATLDDLASKASRPARNINLTVEPTNTIKASDAVVLNVYAFGAVTIDFGAVQAGDITINVSAATAVTIKGATAKFTSLTIDAPYAHVENNVATTKLVVKRVAASTMEQKGAVDAVELAGTGKLMLTTTAGEPTIDVTTANAVEIAGTKAGAVTVSAPGANVKVTSNVPTINAVGGEANIIMSTINPVTLSGDFSNVRAEGATATITVAPGATIAKAEATGTGTTTFAGEGTITAIDASKSVTLTLTNPIAKVTVSATSVRDVAVGGTSTVKEIAAYAPVMIANGAVAKVSVPETALAITSITVNSGFTLPVVETAKSVEVKGAGTVATVDVISNHITDIAVTVGGTAKVSNISDIGTGNKKPTVSVADTAQAPTAVTKKAAQPVVTFVQATKANGKGKINVADKTNIEFSTDAITYTALGATSNEVVAGTYYVRVKAVPGVALASEPVVGVIAAANGVTAATISGNAIVGNILVAAPNANANGTISYEWKYGETACGTAKTLKVTDAMVGKTITVTISNYEKADATSLETSAATAAVTADKTALSTAIGAAKAALSGVVNVADAGADVAKVAQGVLFVSTTEWEKLDKAETGAIQVAEAALRTNMNTTDVAAKVAAINSAAKAFVSAQKTGTFNNVAALQAALTAACTAATTNKGSVTVNTDSKNVAPNAMWVLLAANTAYGTAITTANRLESSTDATVLAKAITDLNAATAAFDMAKRQGAELNTTGLRAAITAAKSNVASTPVAEDGSAYLPTQKWVLAAANTAYTTAITTAEGAVITTQASVEAAVTALNTATTAFNGAKKDGTKVDKSVLIAAYNIGATNVANVYSSANAGKDVKADKPWVATAAYDAYNALVTAAKTCIDENKTATEVAAAAAALVDGLPTFNAAKRNKIAFAGTQVEAPLGATVAHEPSTTRIENVTLTGSVLCKSKPASIADFDKQFSPENFKDTANKYAAINLSGICGTDFTIVQKNPALTNYKAEKTESDIDSVTGTKIKHYTSATPDAETYALLVQENTEITLEIYVGNQVDATQVKGKDVLKADAAASLIQTIKINTNGLTVADKDAKTFAVTFNSGLTDVTVAPQNVLEKGFVIAPTAPTKLGYTFTGWYKEEARTTKWDFATDKVTAATTLYGKWSSAAEFKAMTDAVLDKYNSWAGVPANVADFGTLTYAQTGTDVAVGGHTYYVSGFTGFNQSVPAEQEGNYAIFQFAVPADVAKDPIVVIKDGAKETPRTSTCFDTVDEVTYFSLIRWLKPGATPTDFKVIIDWNGFTDNSIIGETTYTLTFDALHTSVNNKVTTEETLGTSLVDNPVTILDASIPLTKNLTVPAGHTLVVAAEKTLTVAAGKTLTVEATGVLTNNGTITNSGTIAVADEANLRAAVVVGGAIKLNSDIAITGASLDIRKDCTIDGKNGNAKYTLSAKNEANTMAGMFIDAGNANNPTEACTLTLTDVIINATNAGRDTFGSKYAVVLASQDHMQGHLTATRVDFIVDNSAEGGEDAFAVRAAGQKDKTPAHVANVTLIGCTANCIGGQNTLLTANARGYIISTTGGINTTTLGCTKKNAGMFELFTDAAASDTPFPNLELTGGMRWRDQGVCNKVYNGTSKAWEGIVANETDLKASLTANTVTTTVADINLETVVTVEAGKKLVFAADKKLTFTNIGELKNYGTITMAVPTTTKPLTTEVCSATDATYVTYTLKNGTDHFKIAKDKVRCIAKVDNGKVVIYTMIASSAAQGTNTVQIDESSETPGLTAQNLGWTVKKADPASTWLFWTTTGDCFKVDIPVYVAPQPLP